MFGSDDDEDDAENDKSSLHKVFIICFIFNTLT